jgi:hypothetical protein
MKSLIASSCILGMIGLITGMTVWGATTATISATVTARNISINQTSDGSITYGTVNLSESTSTDPAGINDTETFNNNGSQAKFNIKTSGATGGTAWTAAATADSDQFVHSFTTTTSPTWQILDTQDTYETASSTVDSGVDLNVYMKIDMPTASTDYVQKTITVTVQAASP